MNIFKKVGNWLTEFGNRKAPKTNVEKTEAPSASKPVPKAAPKPLKPYQKRQRHWDERLKAAMSRYSWLSYRWLEYDPAMRLRKKTRRVLNPDGTIKAIAVGRTYRRGLAV